MENLRISRERDHLRSDLKAHISDLTAQGPLGLGDIETLHDLRRELNALEKASKVQAYLISRIGWSMYGDRPTRLFLNYEKSNYTDRVIKQLYNDRGELLRQERDILEFQKSYFAGIYKKRVPLLDAGDAFSSMVVQVLDDLDRDLLDDPFRGGIGDCLKVHEEQ